MSGMVAELIHAGGGLLVLAAATALSIYKPWGRIRYTRRASMIADPATTVSTAGRGDTPMASLSSPPGSIPWPNRGSPTESLGLYVLFGISGLFLLLVILHLVGGGHGGH